MTLMGADIITATATAVTGPTEPAMRPLDIEGRLLAGDERWYLVHALPKRELKAEWHLGAQGFRTFLPQIQKTVRHARKLKTVRAPVFPGYLFIRLDLERDRWLSVRSTVGVARLFNHRDGRPVPVPVGVVESLIERSDGNLMRLDTGLTKGQQVRILSGPFFDFVGTIGRLDQAGRIQVLLQLMGTEVPVSVHRSALSPAA
jgi:transcription elongation factor/antiterminator RfaH